MLLGFALAVELERLGAHDAHFIAEHVSGYDEFMRLARDWPPEKAAEACGVAASDICTFARWMAEADPLVIAPGNGLERSRNGGSGVRAAMALPALLGKLSATSGVVLCARFAFPEDSGQADPHRPHPGVHAHAEHSGYRTPPRA